MLMQELRRHYWQIRRKGCNASKGKRPLAHGRIPWAHAWRKSGAKKTTFSKKSHQLPAKFVFLKATLNQIMATTTIQPGRLAGAENLALSSLDSESRSSIESAAYEKTGDEEALVRLPPSQPSQSGDEHLRSGSRTKLLLWMLANTLATIGIVSIGFASSNKSLRTGL